VDGYGVIESSLKVERCLCVKMKEEDEKFCVIGGVDIGHGCANLGTGRANILEVGQFLV
jgi:hypothetical protein